MSWEKGCESSALFLKEGTEDLIYGAERRLYLLTLGT